MCVTGVALWNTPLLGVLRCGHPDPVSPRTLGVRAVDNRAAAVDHGGGKILLLQLWLSVFSLIFFISS